MAELKGQIIEHICPSCNGIDKNKFMLKRVLTFYKFEKFKESVGKKKFKKIIAHNGLRKNEGFKNLTK